MRIAIAAALSVALVGCAGPTTPLARPESALSVTVEPDGKFITVVGPRHQYAEPFLGVPATNFLALRSWLDRRSGEVVHQLYVEDSYFGTEHKWEQARDQAGQTLRFIPIAKNEITCDQGCSYAEEFAVALPEALLRANPQGLSVIVTAHSGDSKKFSVPGELIAQQLAAVDVARAGQPAAVR